MIMLENLYDIFLVSWESLLILILTAISCSIIGTFLVLRKLSMVSDAISHTVLLGIVLAFFITGDVSSPLLIVGAALFGVITVFSIETLSNTGLVKNDDAVGIIFPLFFSLAVILISRFARNAHLDTDIVLMGEVILAPLNRMDIFGYSLPKALVQMMLVLFLNTAFIFVFFKELKVTTFDKEFASVIGFSSGLLFYALMTLSSLTAVVSFDAVGAILVVSFLITPSSAAYLVTKNLKSMLLLSCVYAVINSLLGYVTAMIFNVSMSGMTAVMAGVTFMLSFLLHREGLVTVLFLRMKKKREFRGELMVLHIGNHLYETDERVKEELGIDSIKNHLMWKQSEIERRADRLMKKGLLAVEYRRQVYILTEKGLEKYEKIKLAYGI